MYSGLLELPWWGYVVVTLVLTHITIASVTIFLHRHQAHRALDLHPVVSHFFRFWLWLTTGMVTKEWAAIHRKHHARCETAQDPHSPQIMGLRKVLLEGTELYRREAANAETLENFGRGTPEDWLERNLYARYSVVGIGIMLAANVILFGPIGITIWAVQMLWIPLFAAGVINGLGHYWGYRNFPVEDASTNIMPWGVLIGGEELHNNHHAYGSSARLSCKWYEFDIGWAYIRSLETFGLAQVKKLAPRLRVGPAKPECDADTLQAVITHRYAVLARYAKSLKRTWRQEIRALGVKADASRAELKRIRRWLNVEIESLSRAERLRFEAALNASRVLQTVYSMRRELMAVWARSSASKEQLVRQLEDWCRRAEASGIVPLVEFSQRLRRYA
ncbi:MAG: fatty acid desaturase [Betaproteobacteria bacterium]|nr:fatty acid desaturase [Betaproteobacteria bacterium]